MLVISIQEQITILPFSALERRNDPGNFGRGCKKMKRTCSYICCRATAWILMLYSEVAERCMLHVLLDWLITFIYSISIALYWSFSAYEVASY